MIVKGLVAIATALALSSCGTWNAGLVKSEAVETFASNGYEVIGYQGYNVGLALPFTRYGGAYVWYTLRKVPDNGITYEAALQQWGGEVHVYNLRAIDAIKP